MSPGSDAPWAMAGIAARKALGLQGNCSSVVQGHLAKLLCGPSAQLGTGSPAVLRCSEAQRLASLCLFPKSLTCCPCGSQLRTHRLSSSKPWVQLYMPSKTGGGGSHTTGTQCPSSHCPLSRHWTFRNFLRKHRCQSGLWHPRQTPPWLDQASHRGRSSLESSLLEHNQAPLRGAFPCHPTPHHRQILPKGQPTFNQGLFPLAGGIALI